MSLIIDEAGVPIGLRGVTMDETGIKQAEANRVEVRMREEIIRAQEEALLAQLAAAQRVSVPRLLVESTLAGGGATAAQQRDAIVELFAVERLLAAVSNNVNQVARHANAGAEFPAEAHAVLDAVRRLVPRIDQVIDELGMTVSKHAVASRPRDGDQR